MLKGVRLSTLWGSSMLHHIDFFLGSIYDSINFLEEIITSSWICDLVIQALEELEVVKYYLLILKIWILCQPVVKIALFIISIVLVRVNLLV